MKSVPDKSRFGLFRSEIQLKKCCKFVIYPELWHVMAQRHQTSGIVFLGNKWGNSGEENSPKNEFCKRPHKSVRLYKIHFFLSGKNRSCIFEVNKLYSINFRRELSGVDYITIIEFWGNLLQFEQIFAKIFIPRHSAFYFNWNQLIVVCPENQISLLSLRVPQEVKFRHFSGVQTVF